jgi:hypothetical protein
MVRIHSCLPFFSALYEARTAQSWGEPPIAKGTRRALQRYDPRSKVKADGPPSGGPFALEDDYAGRNSSAVCFWATRLSSVGLRSSLVMPPKQPGLLSDTPVFFEPYSGDGSGPGHLNAGLSYDMFNATEPSPLTKDGRTYVPILFFKAGSKLLLVQYELDLCTSSSKNECRQRYFIFENGPRLPKNAAPPPPSPSAESHNASPKTSTGSYTASPCSSH